MKRIVKFGTALLMGTVFFGCGSAGDRAEEPAEAQAARVIMLVPSDSSADLEYMLTMEVGVMKGLLEDAGVEVDVATESGEPLAAEHTTLTPDLNYGEVDMAAYDGIMMPCLATADDSRALPEELGTQIREAVADGKPVAAQTGGIVALAELGLLTGKRYAYLEDWAAEVPQFEGAILSGDSIVEDGNIITSAVCPYAARMLELQDGTAQLTEALIAQIKGEG
jgi:putative intracellular protease/amidase